jgi:hypothetical protein
LLTGPRWQKQVRIQQIENEEARDGRLPRAFLFEYV